MTGQDHRRPGVTVALGGNCLAESEARSPQWCVSCWPGCRCSPSPARPAGGNPSGYGCGSSPGRAVGPRRLPSATALGRRWPLVRIHHRRDHPPGGPRAWLTSPNRPFEQRNLPWPVEPAHPARQGGSNKASSQCFSHHQDREKLKALSLSSVSMTAFPTIGSL